MRIKTINLDVQDEVDIDFFVQEGLYANPSYAMRHFIKNGIAEELSRIVIRQKVRGRMERATPESVPATGGGSV